MYRLPKQPRKTKPKTIQKTFETSANEIRRRRGVKSGRFAKVEDILRTSKSKLSNPQLYQLKQHKERVSRHVSNITSLTETAYKTTNGAPLHYGKEANLKRSIRTTAMRMNVPHEVIDRINQLDNKLLNELYQITPDVLQQVYIYAWDATHIDGVFHPPDKFKELEEFFEVYDAFVETRSKYV